MIEKEYGKYLLFCDVCGDADDTEFDSFQDAVDFGKENDWHKGKKNGEWIDICPNCWELLQEGWKL